MSLPLEPSSSLAIQATRRHLPWSLRVPGKGVDGLVEGFTSSYTFGGERLREVGRGVAFASVLAL
jgi:hypothetical protein